MKNGKRVTQGIAEYLATASLEDFPTEAVLAAKGAIIDCLACMLAGSQEPLAYVLCDYVRVEGGTPYAALVNGAMGHVRAFSFSCLVGKAHHVESFAEMGIVAA